MLWPVSDQGPDSTVPFTHQPYGAPVAGSLVHRGAKTSLTLGIISVACLLTSFLCLTIPGVFCAPFAWAIGAKAKREIDASPGTYGNRGAAQTGMVLGIVCTVLVFLVTAALVAIVAFVAITDWSLV